MTYPTTTAAENFKSNFYSAIKAQFASDPNYSAVEVIYGQPALPYEPVDIVAFQGLTATQDYATVSTNRTRNEAISLDVGISCLGFGQTDDQTTEQRAYAILGQLAAYVRTTDTTVGGSVLWCRLAQIQTTGETDPQVLAENRCIEISARFEAFARISS